MCFIQVSQARVQLNQLQMSHKRKTLGCTVLFNFCDIPPQFTDVFKALSKSTWIQILGLCLKQGKESMNKA